MELFKLYSSVVLSIDEFEKQVDDALQVGKPLEKMLSDLGNPSFTPGIDTNGNVFAVINDEIDNTKEKIADAKDAVNDADEALGRLKTRSETTQSILNGLNQAVGQVVEELIQGLVQYGQEAMELAAQTGSEVANQYNAVKESFDIGNQITKTKVGEGLLTLKTALLGVADSLLGVTNQEKAAYILEQIDSYRFERLQAAKENFASIYGMFEEIEMPEEPTTLGDLAQGQISQLQFWKEYNQTVSELENKLGGNGEAKKLLSDLNTGTAEGLSQMSALLAASDQEIAAFLSYFSQVEEERDAAAAKSAEMQLLFDGNVQGMSDTFNALVSGLDQSGAAEANATATSAAAVNGLAANYDSFASMVDSYNAKLATLGAVEKKTSYAWKNYINTTSTNSDNLWQIPSFSTGLDYVPYDNYRALLHEGESVLTKAEATEWRRGDGGSSQIDMDALAQTVAAAVASALNGATFGFDGKDAGHLFTQQVSRDIEQMAWEARFA